MELNQTKKYFIMRKVVEMTLEKTVNIHHNKEITMMQMRETNYEKEVGEILRN